MEIKFNSVEEVLEFASHYRPNTSPGQRSSEDIANKIAQIAREGRGAKIAAIVVYRAATGEGLRESKNAIEAHWPFQLDNGPE